MPTSKLKRPHRKPSPAPQILIIGGVILLVVMILIFKQDRNTPTSPVATTEDLPATQLDRALADNRPTLAFLHSNNCQQCIVMIETVEQGYPEFSRLVTLVKVNNIMSV